MKKLQFAFDYHGQKISLSLFADDHVTRLITASSGFYEQRMLEDIMRRTRTGDLAIDIGAYVGTHTVFLAAVAGLEVIALEPVADSVALLKENVERNGIVGRVTIRQAGAASAPGRATESRGPEDNLGMSTLDLGIGPVEITTIDDVAKGRHVSVVKIDVEGMEYDVLQGAGETIDNSRPLVYVEVAHPEGERAVSDFLDDKSYRFAREFNPTPSQLWIPAEHVTPAIYPRWLIDQASDHAYSLRDTTRIVEGMSDAQRAQVQEMRSYRSQLEKTTKLFSELYKRTQAATRSNNDVLDRLDHLNAELSLIKEALELAFNDTDPGDEEE